VRVEYRGIQLSVLHPIALLKAKAHNLAHLDQTDRKDAKHFRALFFCVRAFLREWLRRCEGGEPPRRIIGLLELALKTLLHPEVLQAVSALRLDPERALPLAELDHSQAPQITGFLRERLPRWEKSLSRKLHRRAEADR
jgi:hypothetical protein